MKKVTSLFSTIAIMLLSSFFIASPAWATTITVRARGTGGSEQVRLYVNNGIVKVCNLTTSFSDYTATTTYVGDCQVKYVNDGNTGAQEAQIDYIVVDGSTRQAENQAVNTGCSSPYSEWLYCNGYIDFGNVGKILSVSPTSLRLAALAGSNGAFNVTSNADWTVSSNQTWLTASPTSGSNNGIVSVTAQANAGSSQRTATVTVSISGGSSQTVSVTQIAGFANLYEVGNWAGFRKAAVSFTFDDDNMQNLYSIAIPLFNEYGYKLTMYPAMIYNPPWSDIQAAAAEGHEVGSHTVDHLDLSTLSDVDQIYQLSQSQAIINSYIAGNQCLTLALPYCLSGNEALEANYYIAARTCASSTPNPATPSNFYTIQSTVLGTATGIDTTAEITAIDDAAASSGGWAVFLIHALDFDNGYSPLSSTVLRESVEYLDAHRDTLWVQTFGNVIRYIKERNAASIIETANTGDTVTISITDTLDNTIYNYPITIRRPLPLYWASASVTQNGSPISRKIVLVNSARYVMFDAVPDGGDVVLSKELYGDVDTNGVANLYDLSSFFDVWLQTDCVTTAGVDLDGNCIPNFFEYAVLTSVPVKFHCFLLLGQSNMAGYPTALASDKVQNSRITVLGYDECAATGRHLNQWAVAVPPLHECYQGAIGPGDWFSKTIISSLPSKDTIGLIPCAISGEKIETFMKVGGTKYYWIIDRVRLAQQAGGVIDGILFNQGESNNGDPSWPGKVQQLVSDLKADLGLGNVPFLAGELLYSGSCAGHNVLINQLPSYIPNCYVISASGLVVDPADTTWQLHFSHDSQVTFGQRYAETMKSALGW